MIFENNGRCKKKCWTHDGRGAHEIKKVVVANKKNYRQRPFFQNLFLRAHDPYIPIYCLRLLSLGIKKFEVQIKH